MNNKKLLSAFAILTLIGAVVAPQAVEAYKGDPKVTGPNYSIERHDDMLKAFQNKDYQAWKKLMQGKGRVTQAVTEKTFAQFAKAHELALQGKTAEAAKIRTELGLGLQNGSGARNGGGYGRNFNK